jgi:hypothetical protein
LNLFELFVKVGVDDQASKKLANISGKLGKGLKTAAKIGTAAVGAAAAGITALTKAAVDNYAEYEQLVGGVDTLFKDASQKVQKYAADAYKTAGMSANDYMANATAFSASLISSLGGDTEKAAEYANRAMVSMSDNANKMGTSLDSIVQTYQSLSRGNMAMLDNLKLGYGGTKAELERLIKDAASYTDIQREMGITVDASSMSFDNIVNAIAVVQGKLGIAGATAAEAGTTIEGSINSMKAAWDNLITGVADKNADLERLINNLVTTIVGDGTANNLGVLGNIMPAVKSALNGAAKLVSNLLPRIIQEIPDIIDQNLPVLIKSAFDIIENVFKGLKKNKTKLIKSIGKAVSYVFDTITNPDTIQGLFDVALELVETLADMLLRDDVLDKLIDSAVKIVLTLSDFIVNNVDRFFGVATKIITSLLNYLLDPENIGKLLGAGAKIIEALASAIGSAVEGLATAVSDITAWLVKKFTGIDLTEAGKEVMKSFFMGLLGVAKANKINVSGIFSADGSHRSGLDYVPYDGYIAELHKGERVLTASEARGYGAGTSIGNITINIDGAKYSDEQSLAEAVAEAIQEMTDRRSAVYA